MNKYRRLTKGGITTVAKAIADPECKTPAEASKKSRNGPVRHPPVHHQPPRSAMAARSKAEGMPDMTGLPRSPGLQEADQMALLLQRLQGRLPLPTRQGQIHPPSPSWRGPDPTSPSRGRGYAPPGKSSTRSRGDFSSLSQPNLSHILS